VNDDKGLEKEADMMGVKGLHNVSNAATATKTQNIIQQKSNGRIIQMVAPGDVAPTLGSQLTKRFKQMSTEGGVTPQKIAAKAIALIRAEVVFPPAPVAPADPLTNPAQTGVAIAMEALRDQLAADNSGIADIHFFKHEVTQRGIQAANHFNVIDAFVAEVNNLLDPRFDRAPREAHLDAAMNNNAELRAAVGATTAGGDQMAKAATDYLAAHPRAAIAELTPMQKGQLTASLRTMPVVTRMLNGTLGAGGGPANLMSGIEPIALTTEAIVIKVGFALTKLGGLVDGNVLPAVGKVPNIEINPDIVTPIPKTFIDKIRNIQRTLTTTFRANASRDNNKVRISALSSLDTIVHEFGHQIEFFLPAEQWLDIQDLLRMRHAAGGGNLISIYPTHADAALRNEAAFNATMPATGTYSARVYDDGSTEVMSMTLEYFSTPENAERMISNDPLQAAIILRIIKPVEFNARIPHNLRALLPRGDTHPAAHPIVPVAPIAPVGGEIGNDDL